MRKISSSVKCSLEHRVQLARRLEVVAERLLDDQARPALRRSRRLPSASTIVENATGGTAR